MYQSFFVNFIVKLKTKGKLIFGRIDKIDIILYRFDK
jgi:hypothetical protein